MDTLKIRLKIARWIAEDLLETLGNEERAQLDAWLAESPEHREEMEDLRRRLLSGERSLPPKEVARRGWEDFMRRRRLVLVRRVMRYAAMIAVPLAVAATVWRLALPGTEEQPVPVAEPIVAGKTQAVLVLADGRQVDLEDVQSLDLREQDGTAISLSDGQVLSYTKEAGDKPAPAAEVFNTLMIPKGGEYCLQLSDSTRIWLNAATRLKYPVVFAGNTRRVELEGEAYFEVTKDPAHPFIVVAGGVEVEVYGTSFNVNTFVARGVETVLVEGSVGVRSVQTGKEQRLQPDRMAVWDEQTGEFEVREVDARRYAEWKSGIFRFSNERLEDILTDLANWYDVSVIYRDDAAKELHFSGYMQRYDNIKTILDAMTEATGVRFAIQGRDIIVQGK